MKKCLFETQQVIPLGADLGDGPLPQENILDKLWQRVVTTSVFGTAAVLRSFWCWIDTVTARTMCRLFLRHVLVVQERWAPFGSGLFAFLPVGRVQGCLATCDGWVQAQHADGSVKPHGKNVVKRLWWELMFQQLLKCHLHIHAYPCAFLPVQIYNFPKNCQTKPHAVGFLYGKHCTLRLWPLHWLA